MVVEDNRDHRTLVGMMLKGVGIQDVVFAEDGAKAWELFENAAVPFDLVISDLTMPGMTGIELLNKVRSAAVGRGVPFIMITASGLLDHVIDAKTGGVTKYIFKPFTADKLVKEVRACLEENA
ncbi:MAG: response regulator [Magnetospirillum sp. WYHS-4]